jgi:hypothetical protein
MHSTERSDVESLFGWKAEGRLWADPSRPVPAAVGQPIAKRTAMTGED